jgi:hypothetical protein
MNQTYPRSFSHIGISVPDVEKAVEFYTKVMGWYTIMEPTLIIEDDSPIGEMCTEVFGEKWEKFKIAHLSTVTVLALKYLNLKTKKNQKTTLSTGKRGSSIFVFKTQM